ncbi:kynureninase [Bacteriovoracaceae bacterium]|nr:kynureninase [Bacteriovoracaceae bacterium]
MFEQNKNSIEAAKSFDTNCPLNKFRDEFEFPEVPEECQEKDVLYFAGHSLGLMPKRVRTVMADELDAWGKYGVEGHFMGKKPWLPYHENITESFSRLVGGKTTEVVAMNSLTVNLHLMLTSFYRPTKNKYKILIENNTFPSDQYAVDSQARFHGYNPEEAVVELKPREGEMTVRQEDLLAQIDELGDELALVMLGNCNYLSGQCFDMEAITNKGHEHGAMVGFNLAHGAGNLLLDLHKWNVDFAVWCSYKYLNSGPGGMAGAFVHEKHHNDPTIPRYEGWWGNNKSNRFEMKRRFDPIASVEAWQLSNPPIFQLASLRASMEIFDEATMPAIRKKGDHLTSYLEWLLTENCGSFVKVQTPAFREDKQVRGSMLSIKMTKDPKQLVESFKNKGVICDFREPDILRISPAPLYNSYEDVYRLVQIIKEFS